MHEVGALLDAKGLHRGRWPYAHLLCLAQSNGIPRSRVDEVLRIVGLEDVAKRRAKGLSPGMGQRLGIASALLGDQRDACLTDLGSRITESPASLQLALFGGGRSFMARMAASRASLFHHVPLGPDGHPAGTRGSVGRQCELHDLVGSQGPARGVVNLEVVTHAFP
jgi:hypothetical protein